MTSLILPAMRFAATPFYTAAGGAINPDAAQALPIFTGDVTLRGGMIGCRIANTFDATDSARTTIQGTVYLIKTTKNFDPALVLTPLPVGWDPTIVQDFNTFIGRILYRKTFLLRDADSAVIEYRLKCQKIDVGDYVADFSSYAWLVLAGNVDTAAARSFAVTLFYNLSFCADAV